jgi:hypothetical protein
MHSYLVLSPREVIASQSPTDSDAHYHIPEGSGISAQVRVRLTDSQCGEVTTTAAPAQQRQDMRHAASAGRLPIR